MIKFLGITLCVLFAGLLFKDKNRPFAVLISVAGMGLLLAITIGEVRSLLDAVKDLGSAVSSASGYIMLMVKVLVITLLTQLVADLCRDNGESALASMTEIISKIVVMVLVLPLFKSVITLVAGLVR